MEKAPGFLARPMRIGSLELPNRLIKSATYECMCDLSGVPENDLIRLHTMIAAGGVGLNIVSYALVDPNGQAFKKQIRIFNDQALPPLRALVEAVHASGGRVAIQLMHGGRAADEELCGGTTFAPSPVRDPIRLSVPRELSASQIEDLVEKFARAAQRAQAAGFDAIQLHAAHGYLISQFLSPYTNRRNDEWGGDAERRRHFLHQVYHHVRDAVGPGFPVMVKLNVTDEVRGGVNVSEVAHTVQALARWGVDCIELSGGFSNEAVFHITRGGIPIDVAQRGQPLLKRAAIGGMLTLMKGKVAFEREAYFLDKALSVAKGIEVPIALVGGMRSRKVMEDVLRTGEIDLISMARPLIREPDFPRRLLAGESDESSCINCNTCVAELAHEARLHCHEPYADGRDPYAGWLT